MVGDRIKKSKRLIVITSGSFPYGGAATNRHLSYLKGLVELGVGVKIFLLQPSHNQSKKSNKNNGVFNGIRFQYITPIGVKSNSLFSKIFRKILAIRKVKTLLKKEINEFNNSIDLKILILTTDPLEIIPLLKLSKENGIQVFHERTEFPFIGINSKPKKLLFKIYLKTINKFDGIFVITNAIKEYLKNYISTEKLIHIPMTVEPERFNCSEYKNNKNKYGRYIAYCGTMYTDKDGVPILIKAFNIIADKYSNINLVLIGDTRNKELLSPILSEIQKSKYFDRIILTGFVNRDNMPELLCKAEILALSRPNNIQAKGGFPTKLGEYLATGNPVVVTAVGEIPDYLVNKKNAYLCEPDSPQKFAIILEEALTHKNRSKEIGKRGRDLVYNVFNYKVQSKKLKKFLYKEE